MVLGNVRATTSPGLTPAATSDEAACSMRWLRREWVISNLPETEIARRSGNLSATCFSNPVKVSIVKKKKYELKMKISKRGFRWEREEGKGVIYRRIRRRAHGGGTPRGFDSWPRSAKVLIGEGMPRGRWHVMEVDHFSTWIGNGLTWDKHVKIPCYMYEYFILVKKNTVP